jgi:L-2-hydroxyglutarate oxidase LhgO
MDEIDCVVIGAGVVGLAAARALARQGRETLILERETLIGAGISSRNSEVIHAGIYYPTGSLKARLCVEGKARLYDYCGRRGVAHRNCGKLIVATMADQVSALESIEKAAIGNGVNDLTWLDAVQVGRMEPALNAVSALLSPSTGIIDSHGYMLSLLGEVEDAGGVIAYGVDVARMALDGDRALIWVAGESAPSLHARLVVNAAGIGAIDLARRIEGFPAEHVPRGWYAKGSYFALSGRSPFGRLIYPVPEPGGLGVHLTIDLGGQARFGPDVEWLEGDVAAHASYDVDPRRAERFYRAIRAYWPDLRDGDLAPAYAGIRPKLSGPNEPAADFRIDGVAHHGIRSMINLFGIESPGLTASLAIADVVARLAEEAVPHG